MTVEEIKSKIESALPGIRLKPVRDSLLIENGADLPRVAKFLKDSPDFRMDYLSSVTAADYLSCLESVYHLYSMEKKTGPIVLRVRANREDPRMPSLVSLFRSAEFQERESYDLFGIVYENHPDLRRIFLWEGFEGFPMRKDYIQEDSEILEETDIARLEQRGIQVSDEMKKRAGEYKKRAVKIIRKTEE